MEKLELYLSLKRENKSCFDDRNTQDCDFILTWEFMDPVLLVFL